MEARFWAKVAKGDGCWEWTGARSRAGYGQINEGGRRGRLLYAHRLAWELEHATPVPPGLFVCHRCDNPGCVNPAHLFIGTQKDNMADMVAKGRGVALPCKPRTILTAAAVQEIRALRRSGDLNSADLARRYGVTRSCINAAASGQNWKAPTAGSTEYGGWESLMTDRIERI